MQRIVHARAISSAARGVGVRAVSLAAVVAVLAVASTRAEAATRASAGCDAANRGSLNLAVPAGESRLRQAAIAEGETLSFTVSSSGTAALAVEGGETSPRQHLHTGGTSTLTFKAPRSDTYTVHLEAEGAAAANVGVRCISVDRASAERALIERRKAFIAARDPDRIRIDRPPTEARTLESYEANPDGGLPREVTASISLSELAAAMKVGNSADPGILDFWFEGRHLTYDTYDINARKNDGNFSVMYFGSKYMLGPDIMLGALAQFDQTGELEQRNGSAVKASGWMAGPYMSVRFGPGVVFDGRAAWGVAEDSVPTGVALDMGPADRRLVRGTLRGQRQVSGWTVAPSVGLSYVEDTPAFQATAFSDAQIAGTGRLDVVPEMKRRFDLDSQTYIEPRLAAGGFLSFDDLAELRPGGAASDAPDLHWKAEAGVAVGVKDSVNLQATGGVESGGQSASDNWSGRLQLNMPLGK